MGDNFDASGKLYRTTISFPMPFYEPDGGIDSLFYGTFDMSNGAYLVCCYSGSSGGMVPLTKGYPSSFFTPDAMANSGIR